MLMTELMSEAIEEIGNNLLDWKLFFFSYDVKVYVCKNRSDAEGRRCHISIGYK